jgi:hypothetical protein
MSEVIYNLDEVLTENSVLPNFSQSKVIVNMGQLIRVNSFGIKIWCEWLIEHRATKQIWLIYVPYAFGRHLSVVNGIVAKNVWIRSIYVPFFSEGLNTRLDVLFSHGIEYDDQNIIRIPEPKDAHGKFMEVDVRLSIYFNFLNNLKKLRQNLE